MSILSKKDEQEVEQIMDGLTGDIRIGMRAYFFLLPYHHIGKVTKVTKDCFYLDEVISVSNAGSGDDAVSKIVSMKAKPSSYEKLPHQLVCMKQSLSQFIPLPEKWRLAD